MSDQETSIATSAGAAEPVRPLVVIKGDASPEEVAALVAVVQGLSAAGGGAARHRPRSVWADPARQVRRPHHPESNGWARSALPR